MVSGGLKSISGCLRGTWRSRGPFRGSQGVSRESMGFQVGVRGATEGLGLGCVPGGVQRLQEGNWWSQ